MGGGGIGRLGAGSMIGAKSAGVRLPSPDSGTVTLRSLTMHRLDVPAGVGTTTHGVPTGYSAMVSSPRLA